MISPVRGMKATAGWCAIACLMMVALANGAQAQQHPSIGYSAAWNDSFGLEQKYAAGYATWSFYSSILMVPDKPFTAQRTFTYTAADKTGKLQLAADAQTRTFTVARDHQGRIHYEFAGGPGTPVTVNIVDPVEHRMLRYEVAVSGLPHGEAQACTQPRMSEISRPSTPTERLLGEQASMLSKAQQVAVAPPIHEELGSKQIEGVRAVGQRESSSSALPDGTVKNFSSEHWFAPDLGLNVVDLQANEQGLRELRTHDVVPGEPDPELFRLPTGYTVAAEIPSCIPKLQ